MKKIIIGLAILSSLAFGKWENRELYDDFKNPIRTYSTNLSDDKKVGLIYGVRGSTIGVLVKNGLLSQKILLKLSDGSVIPVICDRLDSGLIVFKNNHVLEDLRKEQLLYLVVSVDNDIQVVRFDNANFIKCENNIKED